MSDQQFEQDYPEAQESNDLQGQHGSYSGSGSIPIQSHDQGTDQSQSAFDRSNEQSRIYVENLPVTSEQELRELFGKFGEITLVKVALDKSTGNQLGYAFVHYSTAEDAQNAISSMHSYDIRGKNIAVRISNPKKKVFERKTNLYVAGLPKSYTKTELTDLFAKYGAIQDSKVLIDTATGVSRGVGFVNFEDDVSASNAINELNGRPAPGGEVDLLVKFASEQGGKQGRNMMNQGYGPQRRQGFGSNTNTRFNPMQGNRSGFGGRTGGLGSTPGFNANQGNTGGFGQQLQQQQRGSNFGNQGNGQQQNFNQGFSSNQQGFGNQQQQNYGYNQGGYNQGYNQQQASNYGYSQTQNNYNQNQNYNQNSGDSSGYDYQSQYNQTYQQQQQQSGFQGNFGNQSKGGNVSGVALFIFHLPHAATEEELYQLFGSYGMVAHVHIPRDNLSQTNKGFGFVTMSTQSEAEAAIAGLNGYQLHSKYLKVSFKTANNRASF